MSNKRPADRLLESDATKKTMASDEVLNVDPKGDLVVALGEIKQKVRVNSALLFGASPVFRVMLGPKFKEGNSSYSASNPLPLPDDDPKATIDMFFLVHYRSESVNASDIRHLLVVCDKYKCVSNFSYFLNQEMGRFIGKYNSCEILIMSFILKNKVRFQSVAQKIVRQSRPVLKSECHKALLDYYLETVLEQMRLHRHAILKEYKQIALDFLGRTYRGTGSERCSTFQPVLGHFFAAFGEKGVFMPSPADDFELPDMYSILTSTTNMTAFKCSNVTYGANCPLCSRGKQGKVDEMKDIFNSSIEQLRLEGGADCKLCSECFEDDGFGLEGVCKKHGQSK